ncbi:MAG TPA: hypothetical protein VFX44_00895 [Solirubrobacterales bacterium]|nr:hypothetical protein [Solirubrobacterales bacterium]
MRNLRKHLTYSNVISTICLFLLLGGATAIAAGGLGKNTVGSKQLKKNAVTAAKIKKEAVTGAKIKKDTVTGKQVNESTLGTVPSAGIASALTPPEAVHLVGAPGEPPFEGGSHNVGSSGPLGLNLVGFWKDHDGVVHLQGIAETGKATVSGVASVFTLPPGYRPPSGRVELFEMFNEAGTIIAGSNVFFEGDLSGRVLGGEENLVVLDGITYRAES